MIMVSVSNDSSSGVVSNKRPLENGHVPIYKPRKVSAIRDFPPGCSHNALPTNLKPEENFNSGARILETDGSSGVKSLEIKVECQSYEAISNDVEVNMTESLDTLLGRAKSLEHADTSYDKVLFLGDSHTVSSIGGSMKPEPSIRLKDKYRRRRVSAVRDFPPRCGMNVLLPIDEEKQTVTPAHDCLGGMVEVEVTTEVTMWSNVSEGETIEKMPTISQTGCLGGVDKTHVNEEKTETLNDGAGIGPLGEIAGAAVEVGLMDSEECNTGLQQIITEKSDAGQAVPEPEYTPKALANTTIDDTEGSAGKEVVVYSPARYGKGTPPDCGFSSGNEFYREIVHGLMAGPYCPWRKGKVAKNSSDGRTGGLKVRKPKMPLHESKAVPLVSNPKADNSGGSSVRKSALPDSYDGDGSPSPLTFADGEDLSENDKCVLKATPISVVLPDNSNNDDSEGPIRKDVPVYSPGESDGERPSHSFSSADEEDRKVVMAEPDCSLRKGEKVLGNSAGGSSERKKRKPKSSWRMKVKAVARKSSPKVNISEVPDELQNEVHTPDDVDESYGQDGDSPTMSPASRKPQVGEGNLPPFGLKKPGHGDARQRVRETLRLFHTICRKRLQKEEANSMPEEEVKLEKSRKRIDLLTAKDIKAKGKEVNKERMLGQPPGVEVGDEFQYRVELAIVGIHRPYQGGIDWMKLDNGLLVATSIVTSGAYDDDVEEADILRYSGQGGNNVGKAKEAEDQKLERGNLALKNSISAMTPVRVVRGWKETKVVDPADPRPKLITTYVYDGLYTVTKYWKETGPRGKQVFMFELKRNPGQPELAWKELKKSNKSKIRPGVCVSDISAGKEPFAICAVNTLNNEKPPPFNYISKMMYPDWFRPSPPAGCDCTGRCSDSRKCRCAVINGGEIPYNRNGALVETKSLVYECGPHCKCPLSCYNRVSQRGIKIKLEVFKTGTRGWGVRALTSIPSGSFICEYAGELLEDKEAEQRIGSDEYLFDIGSKNYSDSPLNAEEQAVSADETGYTIDAIRYGNVGRFINHSCLPNLHAQDVIYDHDDRKMPHVMLFAMENIPPLQELTYHYNYSVGQVRDSYGNIKVKKCYCGTTECSGRMY